MCKYPMQRMVALAAAIVALCVSGMSATAGISWNVAGSGDWDTSAPNWTGDATTFTDDGTVDVEFNNSAGGTITISSNMSPKTIAVSAASGTYTFTGGPIDAGSLTKSGGGTLVMRGSHTFTGKTVVSNGTIEVNNLENEGVASPLGAPMGADATIDMYPGTLFKFAPPDIRSVYFSTDRTINLVGAGPGTVALQCRWNDKWSSFGAITGTGTGPRTLRLLPSGDRARIRITGSISDTSDDVVSLEVQFASQAAGHARLILEGTNTFSGPVDAPGSSRTYYILIDGSGSLGAGNYTNTIAVGRGIIFDYASSATQELSGVISGGGSLKKSGTGALTLSAGNTYGGGTTISDGTLYAGAVGALGTGNVAVAASGLLVMTANNAMATNATLNLSNDEMETLIMDTRSCEIAALTVNAVAQSNGIYRASAYDWMGGSGSLYVGIRVPPGGMVFIVR